MLRSIRESLRWNVIISLVTFGLALFFSMWATIFQENAGLLISLVVVLMFILIGVLADTVGLAGATAKEKDFHAMASKKIKGAKEAAFITKNAPVFSSLFNDTMGDIAGVVSGAASSAAVIQMAKLIQTNEGSFLYIFISVLITSIIATLTVGGKALFKTVAIYQSTNIVLYTGKTLYYLRTIANFFNLKKYIRKNIGKTRRKQQSKNFPFIK